MTCLDAVNPILNSRPFVPITRVENGVEGSQDSIADPGDPMTHIQ